MRTRDLTNEDIDRIGRTILKAIRVSDEEIDKMVNAEGLFEPVQTAIRMHPRPRSTRQFHVWAWSHAWHWQSALALTFVMVVAAFGLVSFVRQNRPSAELVKNLQVQISPVELPSVATPFPISDHTETPGPPNTTGNFERASTRPTRRPLRHHTHSGGPRPQVEDVGEFQLLTYTGNTESTDNGGQIVRVELPRSSLFALGVELPVESESTTKIKADLLIGEDGVMKAVRIVN